MTRFTSWACFLISVIFIANLCLSLAADTNDGQKASLSLEHSTDGKTWKSRGQISFRASTAFMVSEDSKGQKSVSIEQEKVSAPDVVNLEALAKNGGHYRVRIPSSQGNFVMASVPACQVLASRFVDQITVHMTSSKPIGISYYTSSSECTQKINSETGAWSTRPRIKHGEEGPRPNLDPLGTGRAAGSPSAPAPQAPQEEPGFFGKYWHYLLPIPIMLMLTGICGGKDDEEGPKAKGATRAAAK